MKGIVVINPHSGGGKGLKIGEHVRELLLDGKGEFLFVQTKSLLESLERIEELCHEHNFEVLIAIGGDGLIHDLLPALLKYQLPLLIIPAGTGNDLARSLGLYKINLQRLLDMPTANKPVSLDLALATHQGGSTPFIQILSTGFDSVATERANNFKFVTGKIKYVVAVLLEVWRFQSVKFSVVIDGQLQEPNAMLVCVANGTSYGGGMKIVPQAKQDDQILDVMVVDQLSPIRLLLVFPRVFFGRHINHPKVHFFTGKEISISGNTQAFADGERISDLPITISIASERLQVYSL